MHTSSLSFFVTLALALAATASPVAQRRNNVVVRSDSYPEGNYARAAGQNASQKGQQKASAKSPPPAPKGGAKAVPPPAANAGQKGQQKAGATPPATAKGSAKTQTAATAPPTTANATAAAPATAADPKAIQDSLTIDPAVVQTTDDGQNPPVDGQSAADVSKNNFANACALGLPKVPITNGQQVTTGSCNPIPIGNIPSVDNMPASKFQAPKNFDVVASNQTFNVVLTTKGIQLGTFTNAQKTYFANPQKLNAQGQIIGHTHIVMETIDSLQTTALTNPKNFFFFKGVNTAQDGDGNVQVEVTGGISPGVYRMCTIVSSATHQPAIVPVAQHGSLDDCVYFSATVGGIPDDPISIAAAGGLDQPGAPGAPPAAAPPAAAAAGAGNAGQTAAAAAKAGQATGQAAGAAKTAGQATGKSAKGAVAATGKAAQGKGAAQPTKAATPPVKTQPKGAAPAKPAAPAAKGNTNQAAKGKGGK